MDITAKAAETTETQVAHEMVCLDKAVVEINAVLDGLFDRLEQVLVAEPPPGPDKKVEQLDNLVPLAVRIKSVTRSIRASVGRMENLQERLEI